MEWQHPEALYLILPFCVAWLVLALDSNRRRGIARNTFAAKAMWSRIFPAESHVRFWVKLGLREIAIVTGLVALAGPRFGTQYEHVVPHGSDLYVLVDVSRSMLADDVPPSRLDRAKADVSALVNRLEGERVGLIAFAGQAVVKCPLTIDYDSFRRALEELDPDSAPRGGTAIGDAIRKALEVFHAKEDRDQAILLITDGDDQQSYPLEAAAVAAERHVTIFTVGLGDADRGARIPQKADSKAFLEYQGEQVWSKLDSSLLEQIALKTSGVYVPAGTRAYDLGELYANHLQGRRGNESAAQRRIRRSERFQIFLALALAALLIDLCIVPYRRRLETRSSQIDDEQPQKQSARESKAAKPQSPLAVPLIAFLALNAISAASFATEPNVAVRDGLRLYSKEKFDEAREKFAAATEELDKKKSAAVAIAAFDEACAYHRKGDLEHARDSYLRAGLSQDPSIAIAAHFNLGNLSAEKARTLSGEKPETVPVDKRQEILDQLAQAIVDYRHCLELRPDHAPSRRNLELVRQWIKYYTDQWHELDRQKRRDESNLLVFLEFMIQTQNALRETVHQLPDMAHSDAFAELRRAQEELREEIPTLRDKIAETLSPKTDPQGASTGDSKEVEEGIALLRDWADTAGRKMSAASDQLRLKEQAKASTEQQAAVDELDKIWEAIIPFHPLLAKLLSDQTSLAKTLSPNPSDNETPPDQSEASNALIQAEEKPIEAGDDNKETPSSPPASHQSQKLEIADDDFSKFEESQSRTLKRTRLLVPKAEAELNRIENTPSSPASPNEEKTDEDGAARQSAPVDPELVKEGLRKAIELAPQAVQKMEAAVKAMHQKDRKNAAERTEEARKILEEIQDAQPKNEQKQDQQKQDNQNQKQKDEQKSGDDKKEDSQKNEEQKDKDQSKNDEQSKDKKQKPEQQVSQDRVEDALRKVRERQQEKRERDRKLKGKFLGKTPVDKDW